MKTLFAIILVTIVVGCAPQERQRSYLLPTGEDSTYRYYSFQTYADATLPDKSEKAEMKRKQWLEEMLQREGTTSGNYEIISRNVVAKRYGTIGSMQEVTYELRLKK